ncbi:phosphoribosylanthranilate isomerase [Pedobacter cryophilus]|uniref:N-(5'-phosphoribosyl)anthranilate isomerase n=1 Tax=Pedobacter cryophilus TaxID=2571271 RepID=A0A4U1BXY0_9SPHI|nr:phosphoribosylanthranilate isomerase [Pedobacter cryophilus]TKB97856.1 phosphoribosylanthranilate isomerase [Pedobacter cryophilus]
MSLKIKVCGMKYLANIKALAELEPDFMGFIFYPPSQRFIGVEFERNDVANLPPEIQRTAVFVNAHLHEVIEFANLYGMKTIQLHGQESPEFCGELRAKGFKVIKAFGVDENFNFEILNAFVEHVDFFLFDTKTSAHGGSGLIFDWRILQKYNLDKPFLLSGGLSPDNLAEVLKIEHKNFYGVDLNSKFEIEPALKDIEKLEKAFELIRA